jgi:hypothetical protein
MIDQLPDDRPTRIPPEHPTDPPDGEDIHAINKPAPEPRGVPAHAPATSLRASLRAPA